MIALAFAPGKASEQSRRDEDAERIGKREYTSQETPQEGFFRVSNCDKEILLPGFVLQIIYRNRLLEA